MEAITVRGLPVAMAVANQVAAHLVAAIVGVVPFQVLVPEVGVVVAASAVVAAAVVASVVAAAVVVQAAAVAVVASAAAAEGSLQSIFIFKGGIASLFTY